MATSFVHHLLHLDGCKQFLSLTTHMIVIFWLLFFLNTSYCENNNRCVCEYGAFDTGIPCAYIFICNEKLEGELLHFKTNEKVELCCKTACWDCVSNDTSLTILKDGVNASSQNGWNLNQDGECTARLSIPSVQNVDSGDYSCYNKDKKVAHAEIFVIDPIDPPKVSSVIYMVEGKKLLVQFDPGKLNKEWKDTYSVFMNRFGTSSEICTRESIFCDQRRCHCLYSMDVSHALNDNNVTISIIKTRSVQKSETHHIVNLIEHVQPGPVSALNVVKECPSISLEFCAPIKLKFPIEYMMLRKKPLVLTMEMTKNQGFYEKIKVSVIIENRKSLCVKIPLSHLIPFTNYNILVTAYGGGGSGKESKTSFLSCEDVPKSPPEDVHFWIAEDIGAINGSEEYYRKSYSLNINWKLVPHDEKGGEVWYEVIAFDNEENILFNDSQVFKPYVVLRRLFATSLQVKIHAVNKHGRSQNCSHLIIQKSFLYSDLSNLESHIEIENQQARFFIERPKMDVNVFAIYACNGYQDPEDQMFTCKDYPQLLSKLPNLEEAHGMLSDVISLKAGDCTRRSATYIQQKECSFYKNRKFQSETSIQECYFNVTSEEGSVCMSPATNDLGTEYEEYNSKNGSFQLKFLFSIAENGMEKPQLFPFKCYYDSRYDNVQLHFDQSEKNDRLYATWKPLCDFNNPRQFLPSHYHVYTSTNDECQPNDGSSIKQMKNILLSRTVFELPLPEVFICVVSFHSFYNQITKSSVSHHFVPKLPVKQIEQTNTITIVLIIIFLSVFLVTICIIVQIYKKWNRRKHNLIKLDDGFLKIRNLSYEEKRKNSLIESVYDFDPATEETKYIEKDMDYKDKPTSDNSGSGTDVSSGNGNDSGMSTAKDPDIPLACDQNSAFTFYSSGSSYCPDSSQSCSQEIVLTFEERMAKDLQRQGGTLKEKV